MTFMDGQGIGDYLNSSRELSAFAWDIRTAESKPEVAEILERVDLSEEDFNEGFPDLAKMVLELPEGPDLPD
ncbi:hypothetical protein ACFYRK_00785 [Streptomyces sp. NPDC005381]|uniref:hypothetical protein n=1 Tax=Streptomyces sp. NPDC005381 TaxID=3364714 RepID=UPI00367690BB